MEIKTYIPDASPEELIALVTEKYGNQNEFDYFLGDFRKALDFCIGNENVRFYPIAAYEGERMAAHVALIVDRRLPVGEAFFGFLETPNDAGIFSALWEALLREARSYGITKLKGPVNGSIWHQYRCIKETDGTPFFKTELLCEPYYYPLLTSKKPESEIRYYSAYREPFDTVLGLLDESLVQKFEQSGFSITETRSPSPEEIASVAVISKAIFRTNWGYTELTEREFALLYSEDKLNAHLNTLYVLRKGDEIIGFCSTSKEDDRTLMCKTIGIVPEYQGKGLGVALAYRIHADAARAGFKRILYALIREGNNLQNYPKEGAVIFRRYAAFEFRV